MSLRPRRVGLRRPLDIYSYERALARQGFAPVAGVDEAGRGACAGPLVVAAVVLPVGRRGVVPGLADSKLLTPARRDLAYDAVLAVATSVSVVVVECDEVDRLGVHVADLEAMRRAVQRLDQRPRYALTDGFPVPGLGVPALAVWKGDRVCASVAAASVVAKVTRDRLMVALHHAHPQYDFATHKGYVTPGHLAALDDHGPCVEHRRSFAPVARVDPAVRTA